MTHVDGGSENAAGRTEANKDLGTEAGAAGGRNSEQSDARAPGHQVSPDLRPERHAARRARSAWRAHHWSRRRAAVTRHVGRTSNDQAEVTLT